MCRVTQSCALPCNGFRCCCRRSMETWKCRRGLAIMGPLTDPQHLYGHLVLDHHLMLLLPLPPPQPPPPPPPLPQTPIQLPLLHKQEVQRNVLMESGPYKGKALAVLKFCLFFGCIIWSCCFYFLFYFCFYYIVCIAALI